mmetsp:Transcript_19358/g.29144  ORF Transcript_19358/g.29144 Transcript_19358/m.29144 type:complete len:288 (+) Transcript_19358:108-971(+)
MVNKSLSRNVGRRANRKAFVLVNATEIDAKRFNEKVSVSETVDRKYPREKKTARKAAPSNSPKVTKIVCFDTDISFGLTLHSSDYTTEEKRLCWYSSSDYSRMRNERKLTLKSKRRSERKRTERKETEDICVRGLENQIPSMVMRKNGYRIMAWNSVFNEQDLQRHRGIRDVEAIALCYQPASKKCLERARVVGLADAAAVNEAVSVKCAPRKHTATRTATKHAMTKSNSVFNARMEQKSPCINRSSSMYFHMDAMPFSFLRQKNPTESRNHNSSLHYGSYFDTRCQ